MIDNSSGPDARPAGDDGDQWYQPALGGGYPMHPPPAPPADTGEVPAAASQPDPANRSPATAWHQAPYPVVVRPPANWPGTVRPSNNLGIAGFICGLVGFLGWWVPVAGFILGVLGVVLSSCGLVSANRTGSGRGLAIAGLVLGILATPLGFFLTVLVLGYDGHYFNLG